jgi:hypothetical protein
MHWAAGATEAAQQAYARALSRCEEMELPGAVRTLRAQLARLAVRRGDFAAARRLLAEVLPVVDSERAGAIDDPLLCLAGYEILCQEDPVTAAALFNRGASLVRTAAAAIADPGARRHFLTAIPENAEILRLAEAGPTPP